MVSRDNYSLQGMTIDHFVINSKIGEGSFGVVYKASDIYTGEDYAIKMLKSNAIPDTIRENLEKRFYLEFKTGKIKSKNLVNTHTINRFENNLYFVMDYCPNGNLQNQIKYGVIEQNKSQTYALGILKGLNDLHEHGKIHRDLKPENILFDSSFVPKLTDFGISGHINIQLTQVGSDDSPEYILGSYAYMAPEQITSVKRQNTILPTVDIFAFGIICYEMMTGKLPFGPWNTTEDISEYLFNAAKGNFESPSRFNAEIPAKWEQTITQCLQPSRENRFQNVKEIFSLLGESNSSVQKNNTYSGKITISVLDGEDSGTEFEIAGKSLIKIGRAHSLSTNDLSITEIFSNYISRAHCTIEILGEKIFIRDGQWNPKEKIWKKSKNGTYLNGYRISADKGMEIHNEDILILGNTSLKVKI